MRDVGLATVKETLVGILTELYATAMRDAEARGEARALDEAAPVIVDLLYAVAPFAYLTHAADEEDDAEVFGSVTVGDVRRARAVFGRKLPEPIASALRSLKAQP